MFTLSVKPYAPTTDARGDVVDAWGSARDWVVRGVAPGGIEEPFRPNRDLSLVAWTVYANQDDTLPGARDLVTVDGRDYAVNGEPADWTRGPWANPWAGAVVELTRAEG